MSKQNQERPRRCLRFKRMSSSVMTATYITICHILIIRTRTSCSGPWEECRHWRTCRVSTLHVCQMSFACAVAADSCLAHCSDIKITTAHLTICTDLLQATLHNVVCLTSPVRICFSPSRSRAPHSSVTTANGYDDYPSAHATVSVTLFTRAALMRVRARHETVAPGDRLLPINGSGVCSTL